MTFRCLKKTFSTIIDFKYWGHLRFICYWKIFYSILWFSFLLLSNQSYPNLFLNSYHLHIFSHDFVVHQFGQNLAKQVFPGFTWVYSFDCSHLVALPPSSFVVWPHSYAQWLLPNVGCNSLHLVSHFKS